MSTQLDSAGAILLYHRIDGLDRPDSLSVPVKTFRHHMNLVRDRFRPAALQDLVNGRVKARRDRPAVAITFDDGYLDNLTQASPILVERGLPATFFLTTANLDDPQPYWWDVLAGYAGPDRKDLHDTMVHASLADRTAALDRVKVSAAGSRLPRPMSGAEILALASQPAHTIGAHTVNHLFLPAQADDAVEGELQTCRQTLERLLGTPITAVAYPYGGVTGAIASVAAAAGFTCGLTVQKGIVNSQSDVMLLPRIEVTATMDLAAELSGVFGDL